VVEPKTDALVKSVEHLLAEREAVATKEKELIDGLNAILAKMGYQVVAKNAVPKRRGRPPGGGGGPAVRRDRGTSPLLTITRERGIRDRLTPRSRCAGEGG
jgi:hypothetical protein